MLNIEKIKNNLINILDREYKDKDVLYDGILYNSKTNLNQTHCHIKISDVDNVSIEYFDDEGNKETIEISECNFYYRDFNEYDFKYTREILLPIKDANDINKIIEAIKSILPDGSGYLITYILYCYSKELLNDK